MERANNVVSLPYLQEIEVRCVTPLQGKQLDTYVDLLIEAETKAEEIAELEKQLLLKRVQLASVDVKLEIINRNRA